MKKAFFSKIFGSVLAPMAQGAVETVGGMVGEKVVGYLKDHFSSSEKLPKLLVESYQKGLATLEIALAGPKFYSKTSNKEFANNFQNEVVGPFLQKQKWDQEAFLKGALADLEILRNLDLSPKEAFSADELAETVGGFAVESGADFEAKKDQSTESLVGFLREKSAPPHYLCELLAYRNVLSEAISLHFGRSIEGDEELFRHYQLCSAKGMEQRLAEIQKELERSRKERDRELYKKLGQQKALLEDILFDFSGFEAHFGAISADIKDAKDEILAVLEKLQNQVAELKRQKKFTHKASLAASFSIRTDEEKALVKSFLEKIRALPSEVVDGATLREVGSLLSATGAHKDAHKLHDEALSKAKEANDERAQALVYYDQFTSYLNENPANFEKALEYYKNSLTFSPDISREMQLFDSAHYAPRAILGAGGFGIAFLCEDQYVGGKVVVKVILDELTNAEEALREARSLNELSSEYLVPLKHCSFLDPYKKKRAFLVMDYFNGVDLDHWIGEHGAFSEERGIEIARAIALGMQSAHSKGIIHRDLKPANILYGERGDHFELKIIDFGLALRDASLLAKESVRITIKSNKGLLEEALGGTIEYAPPEQLGKVNYRIGSWSDVYSFGLTLKVIFFGRLKPSSRKLRDFPNPDIVDLISDCEEENPHDRLKDFDEVLERLGRLNKTGDGGVQNFEPVSTVKQRTVSAQAIVRQKAEEERRKRKAEEEVKRKVEEEKHRREAKEQRQAEEERQREVEAERKRKKEEERKKREQKTFIEVIENPPEIQGFRFLRKARYSCGGVSYEVCEYLHAGEESQGGFFSKLLGKGKQQTGMEFVLVPRGSFEMGDTNWDDSKPIYTVRLRLKPYLIGKHQVTQKVWKKVMGNNPSRFKGDDNPVEKVSWHDCKKFCEKVGLSLPSEAQWEYACRAGTTTMYYWGDDFGEMDQYGWWKENSGSKTHPVGQKKPNALGLFDMSGNVWEWMEDDWKSDYKSAPNDGSPYMNKGAGERAVRGGSWGNHNGYNFASACRYDVGTPAYQSYGGRGFRLVACL